MVSSDLWMDFALAGSIGISWMAMALGLICYARLRKQSVLTQKLYQRLDHNLQMTNNGSLGMGKRLIALEQQLHHADLQEAANSVDNAKPEAVSPAGQHIIEGLAPDLADAARLLNAGLLPDEVSRRCGISRAEASLMQLMHSQVQGAAA
jgi:hypothetical protein